VVVVVAAVVAEIAVSSAVTNYGFKKGPDANQGLFLCLDQISFRANRFLSAGLVSMETPDTRPRGADTKKHPIRI
jgi:hypothetical protein